MALVRPTSRSRTGSIPLDGDIAEDLDWSRLVSTASKAIESGKYCSNVEQTTLKLLLPAMFVEHDVMVTCPVVRFKVVVEMLPKLTILLFP